MGLAEYSFKEAAALQPSDFSEDDFLAFDHHCRATEATLLQDVMRNEPQAPEGSTVRYRSHRDNGDWHQRSLDTSDAAIFQSVWK